jgi:hypothetical protein
MDVSPDQSQCAVRHKKSVYGSGLLDALVGGKVYAAGSGFSK